MDRFFNIVDNNGVAEIEIKGDIGGGWSWDDENDSANTKDLMRQEIEALKNIEADSILLKIDSYGGSVHHGAAMLSALKDTEKTINVEYIGYSASAATFFGTIAKDVIIPENLMVLFHEAQSVAMGTAEEIESTVKELKVINNMILDGYVEQSKRAGKNKSKEELRSLIGRAKGQGEWIEASEMLEFGLATKVKKVYSAVASARPTKENLMKFNLPEPPVNIINPNNNKEMGIFNKKLNSLKAGDVTAVYEGKLNKGTELNALNGGELKNDTYEIEGYSVEITDNKVTNYAKISETKEAVNVADFKTDLEGVQNSVKEIQNSSVETSKATNEAIEKLTNVVNSLAEKLDTTITEGSKIEIPENEHAEGSENQVVNYEKESRDRLKAKAKARKEAQIETKIN